MQVRHFLDNEVQHLLNNKDAVAAFEVRHFGDVTTITTFALHWSYLKYRIGEKSKHMNDRYACDM